jgi:drug/metabolite transporter (DMT)-like permease
MTTTGANSSNPTTTDDSPERPSLAIAMLLGAMFVFTVMDGMAKILAQQGMPPERIILLRYAMVMALLVPALVRHWGARPYRTTRPVLHILRGMMLIASATLFVYAMRSLPLETATAIGFVSPLYVTALSIPFLGEKVGLRRWVAVVVGFGGVLIILRPGTGEFQAAMLIPLVSSLCWAVGLIITRAMRGRESPLTILIWSTVSGFVVIFPLGVADWETPPPAQAGLLAAIGACHATGQYLTIRAFMQARASMLAPFSYSTMVWATLIGLLVFNSVPDAATLAGAAVLVGAGLYVWHRERVRDVPPTVPGGSIAESAQEPPVSEKTSDNDRHNRAG